MVRGVWIGIMGALALGGCGMPQGEFQAAYLESLCEHVMACSDPAQLTFDGILTQEDCKLQRGEEVGEWGVGCKFRASLAEACLEDMAALTCPAGEGQLAARPDSCALVFEDCQRVEDTEPETEETDAEVETTAG